MNKCPPPTWQVYLRRVRWLLVLLPTLLGAAPTHSAELPVISIAFIDVGQGDATLLRDGNGYDILVDGGRKSAGDDVLDYLQGAGVDDLEIVLATHADSDHIGGLITVIESDAIPIENIYYNGYPGDTLTWQQFVDAAAADGLTLVPIQYPQLEQWGGFSVQVLNPTSGLVDPDQNGASVVLIIDYAQLTVILPADIDSGVEQLLPSRTLSLQAEVLKVAHHGSASSTSSQFLAEVQPGEAILSVGTNAYGHPAPETIDRLVASGTTAWRTDLLGTILITSDGSSYKVSPRVIYLPTVLTTFIHP